jgi:transposase-like protein
MGYDKHFRVNHGNNEFSKGHGIHINGIENFWSFTKRRLAKFNGIKPYFKFHLKESDAIAHGKVLPKTRGILINF